MRWKRLGGNVTRRGTGSVWGRMGVGIVLCAVVLYSCATRQSEATSEPGPLVRTFSDIVYASPGGKDLMLDVTVPTRGAGPFPVLVFFPGNGWGYYRNMGRQQMMVETVTYAMNGYVTVAVDTRSSVSIEGGKPSSVNHYPAALYDAKAAIRWVRGNARKYKIDPKRLGVGGWSSGGTIALRLAVTRPGDGLEGDEGVTGYSTAVRAAVITGVEVNFDVDGINDKPSVQYYLGGTRAEIPQIYRQASPIRFVRSTAAPIFQLEGELDHPAVDEAKPFHALLDKLGVPNKLVIVPYGGHRDYIARCEECPAFFDRYVKGTP